VITCFDAFDLVDNHIQKPDSLLGFLGKGSGIFIGPVLKEQVGSGLDGGASSNTCTFSVQNSENTLQVPKNSPNGKFSIFFSALKCVKSAFSDNVEALNCVKCVKLKISYIMAFGQYPAKL